MVLRLQYLKYQVKGMQLLPYFLLHPQDQALPQRLIDHIEAHVAKPQYTVDFDAPLTWAPDNRIVRALITTLFRRFYSFTPLEIRKILSDSQLTQFQRQGIDSLEDFRLWFWDYIQKHHNGFFHRKNRLEVQKKVAQQLNIEPDLIEPLLNAHREENTILHRNNGMPSSKDLIEAYNYEVLETLLYNSDTVTLRLSGTSLGATARCLLKYTKRYGVLVDLQSPSKILQATISGPRLFFGRATSYGWNIAQVISNLLREAPSLGITIKHITIEVILRNRQYLVTLAEDGFPEILPKGPIREDEAFLDSKVEKQFYWSWHNNKFRGWDIIREPEAFIFGSQLIIPDFALIKGDHRVLVEIIGYWREEYTQKKQAQLEQLKQNGLQHMILLVDSKHRQQFTKSIYPTVYYKAKGNRYEIPYGKILKALPQ
jgi:predicted nuclease of restriction endonuclease-like RecB superfamily